MKDWVYVLHWPIRSDHPLDFASCKPKGKENMNMWKDRNIKRTPQIAHKIKLEILSKSAKLLLLASGKKKKKDQTDCTFWVLKAYFTNAMFHISQQFSTYSLKGDSPRPHSCLLPHPRQVEVNRQSTQKNSGGEHFWLVAHWYKIKTT